jgi:hypothetical protein
MGEGIDWNEMHIPPSVLGISNRVADDVLKVNFEGPAGLLVNDPGDAFHAATTGQATDRWPRNTCTCLHMYGIQIFTTTGRTLNVIAENLVAALCSAFAKALTTR